MPLAAACSGGSGGSEPAGPGSNPTNPTSTTESLAASCQPGQPLTGATYDISRSKFAFGSMPVPADAEALVRWTGADGVVAVWSDGSAMGVMNAGAPESNLPDWSTDGDALAQHVRQYFEAMGVADCQVAGTEATYSAGGGGSTAGTTTSVGPSQTTSGLARAIDGVRVAESTAFARFDTSDQTTWETFYWPTIPADVVAAARAFHDQLSTPGALAAFKAKLPANAQGDGQVVIHHTPSASSAPFTAVATYDVIESDPVFGDGSDAYFDPNGNPIGDTWDRF
jgi:hypothetical protein